MNESVLRFDTEQVFVAAQQEAAVRQRGRSHDAQESERKTSKPGATESWLHGE